MVELLKALSLKEEVTCELAVMSHDIHYRDVKRLNIRMHYLIRNSAKDPRVFLKLYSLCKKIRPDILHSWNSMTSVYAIAVTKALGIKFINGMIRDAPSELKLFSEAWIRSKLTFPFSDIIVSNSRAGIESYRATMARSFCIHNGFDFDRIDDLEDGDIVRKKFGIDSGKVVGMVGTFWKNKDYGTYIKAAQMVLQQRADVTFLAVGDGENLNRCKSMVLPQFRSRIKFLGRQEDVESIINIFDIGVLATYTEGISNSIMEYMALSQPVVATQGGGTRELVIDGVTGFLVQQGNYSDMGKRILELLQDEELATAMGQAGRERIRTEFSLERMADAYVGLYRRTLQDSL